MAVRQHSSLRSAASGCGSTPLPLLLSVNSWLPPLLFYYLKTYPVLNVAIETKGNKSREKKSEVFLRITPKTPGHLQVGDFSANHRHKHSVTISSLS